jgi:hypothetical protein
MSRRKIPKVCVDRILEGSLAEKADQAAWRERYQNQPLRSLSPGTSPSSLPEPLAMAILPGKMWKPGRTLRVRFLDGVDVVKAKVEQMVHIWETYANIRFLFGNDPDAEIRISFVHDPGSWSYLGTDALVMPKDQPTVNFGWLQSNTANSEYERVVVHEFGHALGCVHEHSSPAANIPWNKPAVYRYYAGPPNNWSQAKVDANIFFKYDETVTNHSVFDPLSIMIYPIPKEFTDGVFEVKLNNELSDLDKTFIASMYPPEPKPGVELTIGASPVLADIGQPGEEDLFHFTVAAPGTYVMETTGGTDMVMGLFGPNDLTLSLASDDDSGPGLNSRLSKLLQPGVYYLRLRHYQPNATGKYGIYVAASA